MKHLLTATALLVAATAASAQTQESRARFFLSAGPSFGYFGDDFDSAPGVNLTLGVQLPNTHSVEFAASYFWSEYDGFSRVDAAFAPLLGKYRVPVYSDQKLTVAVAGAVGAMYEKVDGWWFSETDVAFAVGAEGAVDYKVSEAFSVGVGLTALYTTETDITTDGGISLINFRASWRF